MNKLFLLLISVSVAMFVWAGSAFAYTIDDNTLVLPYRYTAPYDGDNWVDRIGDSDFEVYGIDVSYSGGNITFDLYTNFNNDGIYDIGGTYAWLADLALDVNVDGTYDYGVVLLDHDEWTGGNGYEPSFMGTDTEGAETGDIYDVTEWETSQDFWKGNTNFIYGGEAKTGSDAAHDSYVAIKAGEYKGNADVTRSDVGDNPNYKWSVTIAAADIDFTGNEIGVFWGGMTCSNDAIEGTASIPDATALVLLGSAMLIGGVYGRKKAF